VVESQPGQIVCKTLSRKNPSRKRAGGVAQDESPEFKHQALSSSPSTAKIKKVKKITFSITDTRITAHRLLLAFSQH
jgi:hypothetical protein